MNPTLHAYRTGWRRALIETRISLTTPSDVLGYVLPVGIAVVVLLFLRGVDIEGAPVSLGSMNMPSLVGMFIVWGGVFGVLGILVMDRTNGTLLRAKSMPGGMTGYLIGHIGSIALFTAAGVVVLLAVGLLLFDGLEFGSPDRWLTFLAVLALGMAATMPIGAVLGALIDNPRNMGVVMLPFMALMAVSGIFYPLGGMPGWAQAVGQVFPMYWAGLGMRHAMLADSAVVVEIGGSWRTLTMFAVLAAWSITALAAAPKLLSRMARRESGSTMAARRQKMYQEWG
ncbi:ABC transporter permease [Glycomyces xiaoerkulensis]|uniref:ABC transporter permease n=1 Tax=Glycomyces xiaoerkulensis TaxID=2038139 RepID=UPI000C257053|nr:ABC transporter permease [Glycomyces xiaoerkulensis]